MNRRTLIVALAIALPLVVFVAIKRAASWRPHRIGALIGPQTGGPTILRVSARYALASRYFGTCTRFDLASGQRQAAQRQAAPRQAAPREGITEQGAWIAKMRIDAGGTQNLVLTGAGQTRNYAIEDRSFGANGPTFENDVLSPQTLRVSPALNRVELIISDNYYRWNMASGAPERDIGLLDRRTSYARIDESVAALARDGESAVTLNSGVIVWRSTRQYQVLKRLKLRGFRPATEVSNPIDTRVSPYGTYGFYRVLNNGVTSPNWAVMDTHSARVLWRFRLNSLEDFAVCAPDESVIALPIVQRKRWEIRDAKTGALQRTLPLLAGTTIGAFSPDGAMLYSVADGVLYRQRAR